jgi:hypothetical protein
MVDVILLVVSNREVAASSHSTAASTRSVSAPERSMEAEKLCVPTPRRKRALSSISKAFYF